MSSSLTDTPAWRGFCLRAADDLSLLDSGEAALSDVLVPLPGGTRADAERRYAAVAEHMADLFGSLAGMRVVELGGGYGGQASVLLELFDLAAYSIIDLPEPNALQEAYLAKRIGYELEPFSPLNEAYDLAVSNYALTELRRPFQEQYARELARCRFGYITCNGFTTGELDQAELEALLPAHAEHAPAVKPSNPRCTVVYWRPQ